MNECFFLTLDKLTSLMKDGIIYCRSNFPIEFTLLEVEYLTLAAAQLLQKRSIVEPVGQSNIPISNCSFYLPHVSGLGTLLFPGLIPSLLKLFGCLKGSINLLKSKIPWSGWLGEDHRIFLYLITVIKPP